MSSEADKKLSNTQEKVRKDPKSCDHIGFFMPLGQETFPTLTGGFVVQASVLCIMCGKQFHGVSEIRGNNPVAPRNEPSKITLPS